MVQIDPERERRRLAEFYSGQMDGKLEKVAGHAYELTDLAREALRLELAKRRLNVELIEQAPITLPPPVLPGDPPPATVLPDESDAPDGELELRHMVTIRKFRDLPEALLAKCGLDSAGIECALVDDNIVRLDWFWSNLMGGVKLLVDPEDSDAANEILNQPIPDGFDTTGTGEYPQPRCPKCLSLDVSFQELNKPIAFATAYLGVPIPVHRKAWRCSSCHVEWEDDGVPDSTDSQA
jgi:hypothetical protein